MYVKQAIAAIVLSAGCVVARAQLANQVQLKIEPSNRTLTISAEERVTADPEIAILHIGFETQATDAKAAYAAGAKTSGEVVAALKQAGIPETSIRSETQHLDRASDKSRKFKLVQSWTVKTPPERVAEILDIAVAAGATESGEIEWTVHDEDALEGQALNRATARAKANATVLAGGMGAKLGLLIFVSNQVSTPEYSSFGYANNSLSVERDKAIAPQLAIEPRKVSRTATVYAVYAIE
jgi:uncharacterized protein YggE